MPKQKVPKTTEKTGFWQRLKEKWMPDRRTFGGILFGAVIGAVTTAGFSYIFYVKASNDLIKTSENLRRETEVLKKASEDILKETARSKKFIVTLFRYMEGKGLIEGVEYDDKGEPKDFTVKATLNGTLPAVKSSLGGGIPSPAHTGKGESK